MVFALNQKTQFQKDDADDADAAVVGTEERACMTSIACPDRRQGSRAPCFGSACDAGHVRIGRAVWCIPPGRASIAPLALYRLRLTL